MLDMLKCLTYVSFLLFILSLSGIYVTLAFSFTIFSLSKVECYVQKFSYADGGDSEIQTHDLYFKT